MVWVLDKANTEITFSVEHLMVSTVHGRFTEFEADLTLYPDQPGRSRVSATIATASLQTDNPARDNDLKSADFLDAAAYPEISFVSEEITRLHEDAFWIRGDLSMHGVTRSVVARGLLEGPTIDAQGHQDVKFTMAAEVDRADFDLTFGMRGLLVGKTVTITIKAEVREVEGEASAA